MAPLALTPGNKLRRLVLSRRTFIGLVVTWVLLFLLLSPASQSRSLWRPGLSYLQQTDEKPEPVRRMENKPPLPPLSKRIPCYGPRGKLLSDSPDDAIDEVKLDIPYPIPWSGSYQAIGLEETWTTIDGRYGPYGFNENDESYNRTRVDWDRVDWHHLQKQCLNANAHRFPPAAKMEESMYMRPRFRYKDSTGIPLTPQWHHHPRTRRTAIVVRTWRGFKYMDEDLRYIRSVVAEATLNTGAEYQVILLVDMKDYERDIFASEPDYLQGLDDSGVPREFVSMAVLWDNRLLDDWYPKVPERNTMWQVFQPMQLFALHYPEFDHYWQIELDMRITSHVGKYFDRMGETARNEPRKQSFERALFLHMGSRDGDYTNFSAAVDKANGKSAHYWGPIQIPDIDPVGPKPPVERAVDDPFEWGVGEEADVIVTGQCRDVPRAKDWVFRDWVGNFELGRETPRIFCAPAIQRASRNLLLLIHQAQFKQGLYLPSEATLPSFALWHGLKFSYPRHPVFYVQERNDTFIDDWWFGGPLNSTTGAGPDRETVPSGLGKTFHWQTEWPRLIMDGWEGRKLGDDQIWPWILAKKDGKVYAPAMVVHPMKHRVR